jgi:hypothetical protein
VIVFPGGFNWPIWVAQDNGYFARGGIEVELTNTPNSVFQLINLIDGKFDIAMTAIDNVVAYMEGQGEAPVATKGLRTLHRTGKEAKHKRTSTLEKANASGEHWQPPPEYPRPERPTPTCAGYRRRRGTSPAGVA